MWHIIDYEKIDNGFLKDRIGEVLHKLTDRERTVIYCRFWEEMTFESIGKFIGVTRGSIQQIEVKALRKLRHDSLSKYLEEFRPITQCERKVQGISRNKRSLAEIRREFWPIHLYARKLPLIYEESQEEEKRKKLEREITASKLSDKKRQELNRKKQEAFQREMEAREVADQRLRDESFNQWYKNTFGRELE